MAWKRGEGFLIIVGGDCAVNLVFRKEQDQDVVPGIVSLRLVALQVVCPDMTEQELQYAVDNGADAAMTVQVAYPLFWLFAPTHKNRVLVNFGVGSISLQCPHLRQLSK